MVTNTTIYTRQIYCCLNADSPDVEFRNGDEVILIDQNARMIYDEENHTFHQIPMNGGGGGGTLITKTITANGIYAASTDNADGYSEVTVAVPPSGYVNNDWLDPTKPIGEVSSDATSVVPIGGRTGITKINIPNVTTIPTNFAYGCTGLDEVVCPNATQINGGAFSGTTGITKPICAPKATIAKDAFYQSTVPILVVKCSASYTANTFQKITGLTTFDMVSKPLATQRSFLGNHLLSTLILRSTTIVPCGNVDNFENTPFWSGGTGGTIYIPKVLYDHLGDGSASDYKAATNWSTVDGYGTITWAQIEGSVYETQYADGTPIS